MREYLGAVLCIGLLAAPVASQAGALEWIEQAYDRFNAEAGYSNESANDWFAGRVNQGNAWIVNFTPQQSGRFRFVGACDSDCSTFRVTVLDFRGTDVARQIGYSGSTTTYAYLAAGQAYRIQYYPEDCDAPWCYVVGAIYD
ncbi:hypothetical protein [Aurantiacibacter luteus]|uniref:Secreted protein n=1 Tax=Aurantiacibacter luteus TaxID=1581420 RepID=A0A0G9N2C9_9SPHN|nr:hypothetical protein [Aurantiacibacter luteus]KLE35678.1 hypothetical protein AAW00_04585 [Aurantiacibacter luteus]